MSRMLLTSLLALALFGCEATDSNYPGPVLATLRGTMTAQSLVIDKPVHLAIAWFSFFSPESGQGIGRPKGVVTSDITYTGTFPQNFSFDLTSLPPASAIVTDNTGVRGATGIVLAYLDSNGDGQLTVSTDDSPVVDRVIGASADFTGLGVDPTKARPYIVYVENDPPADQAHQGWVRGYNLVTSSGSAMGATALSAGHLALELVDDPRLSLMACDTFYARLATADFLSTTNCGIAPYFRPAGDFTVSATVVITKGMGYASVSLFNFVDGGVVTAPADAGIEATLNGTLLEALTPGVFSLSETPPSVIREGVNTVKVGQPGKPVWEASCTMPKPFTIVAPEHVAAGSMVTVSVEVEVGETGTYLFGSGTQYVVLTGHTASVVAPAMPGPWSFDVTSVPTPSSAKFVNCSRVISKTITVD